MSQEILFCGIAALLFGLSLGYALGVLFSKKNKDALQNQLGQIQGQLQTESQRHQQELQTQANMAESRLQMTTDKVRLQVQAEESLKISELQQHSEQEKRELMLEAERIRADEIAKRQLAIDGAEREKTALKLEIEQLRTQIRTEEDARSAREAARNEENLARQELEIEKVRKEERAARQAVIDRAESDKTQLKLENEQLRSRISSEEVMLKQFKNIAGEALEGQGNNLRDTQIKTLEPLLTPLREKLGELGKSMHDSNILHEKGRSSMETLVKNLMERAEGISADARNLTRALKGENKTQGDWGEMILEKMLENVGLNKDEEYFTQQTFVSPEGVKLRPDLIIKLPGNRQLIIDSKVSLTAYARACEQTDNEDAVKQCLCEHVASVRKHIAELADKNYPRVVENSLNYVLMFIPNEASYIAAVQHEPRLPEEAYRRNILLVSPTNMLMALQIAQNLWDREKQNQNVQEIIKKATNIYDKLCGFCKSFDDAGDKLKKALEAFEKSSGQLRTGKGNALKQLDELRKLGLSPKKLILDSGDNYIDYDSEQDAEPETTAPEPQEETEK